MVTAPENSVPAVAPKPPSPPQTARARARRAASGYRDRTSVMAEGAARAAPAPWTNRVARSVPKPGAKAAAAEAAPKTATPATSSRRRP